MLPNTVVQVDLWEFKASLSSRTARDLRNRETLPQKYQNKIRITTTTTPKKVNVAGKMVEQVRVLAPKSNNLTSFPRTQTMERTYSHKFSGMHVPHTFSIPAINI